MEPRSPGGYLCLEQRKVRRVAQQRALDGLLLRARRDLLVELGLPVQGPTVMRSDNKSVKDLSLDAVTFKKTKHILRAAMFLRDLCLRLIFTLRWISGETNPADLFTKAHPVTVFRALMRVFDRLQYVA